MRKFLLLLLLLASPLWAQERLEMEMVTITPTAWWRSNYGTTQNAQDRVSAWTDQSGNGRNWSQGTTGNMCYLSRDDNQENLVPASENLADTSYWNRARCAYSGGLLTEDNSPATTHVAYTNGFTATVGRSYRYKARVKTNGRSISLRFDSATGVFGGTSPYAHFDLANGTVHSTTGTVVNATITPDTNGYYIISAECAATIAGTALFNVYLSNPPGTTNYSGDLVSGAYVSWTQAQDTTADNVYIQATDHFEFRGVNGKKVLHFEPGYYFQGAGITSDIFGASAKTVFITFRPARYSSSGTYALFGANAGYFNFPRATTTDFIGLNYDGTDDTVALTASLGAIHVAVFTHDGVNLKAYLDGGAAVSTASGPTSNLTTALLIGSGGVNSFAGDLLEIATFNRVLNAAEISDFYRYLRFQWGL